MEWKYLNQFLCNYLYIGASFAVAHRYLKVPNYLLFFSGIFVAIIFSYRITKHLNVFIPWWLTAIGTITYFYPNYDEYATDSSVGKEYVFIAANIIAIGITAMIPLLKKALKNHPNLKSAIKTVIVTTAMGAVVYVSGVVNYKQIFSE